MHFSSSNPIFIFRNTVFHADKLYSWMVKLQLLGKIPIVLHIMDFVHRYSYSMKSLPNYYYDVKQFHKLFAQLISHCNEPIEIILANPNREEFKLVSLHDARLVKHETSIFRYSSNVFFSPSKWHNFWTARPILMIPVP